MVWPLASLMPLREVSLLCHPSDEAGAPGPPSKEALLRPQGSTVPQVASWMPSAQETAELCVLQTAVIAVTPPPTCTLGCLGVSGPHRASAGDLQ